MDKETKIITLKGVYDTIDRMVKGNSELLVTIYKEIDVYARASDDFGREAAKVMRYSMVPAVWWQIYGICVPNLQASAIKVLSQTCSSSGCERNWSIFERIRTNKSTKLEHGRLCDLVYVHYNLRLMDRKTTKKLYYDPISLDDIDVLEEWMVEEEEPLLNEDDIDTWNQTEQSQTITLIRDSLDFEPLMTQEDS